jgi:hypothetical protein
LAPDRHRAIEENRFIDCRKRRRPERPGRRLGHGGHVTVAHGPGHAVDGVLRQQPGVAGQHIEAVHLAGAGRVAGRLAVEIAAVQRGLRAAGEQGRDGSGDPDP